MDQTTVFVAPSYNNAVGLLSYAVGSDAASALGAANPPTPERCCSICRGEDYEGVSHGLFSDAFQTQPFDCVAFALQFMDDATLNGWYCSFYTTSATSGFVDSGTGTRASSVYVAN